MANRIVLIVITLLCLGCKTAQIYKPTFTGSTTYSKSQTEKIETHLGLKYRADLYETTNKKYLFYINGKLIVDHDYFGQNVKTGALTSFGIDF